MFHVEQYIKNFFSSSVPALGDNAIDKLSLFARRVFETNKKFNLTGFSTLEDITEKLILQSIKPLQFLNVPRGTPFIDMGTGAGIPGIPLAIIYPAHNCTLVDSNMKKINFLTSLIRDLRILNATAVYARGEEIAHNPSFRESFFLATSRAFANIFITSEVCAPFIKIGGYLYVYSNYALPELTEHHLLFQHFSDLGLRPANPHDLSALGLSTNNIVFIKTSRTPEKYPRRFAAIKREAQKFN